MKNTNPQSTRDRASAEDLHLCWRDYRQSPHEDLRNGLIESYLHLVCQHAERLWQTLPECVELDDLISAGAFGLMNAIETFDIDRGVKFETYCVLRIRGAMLDELRRMDWVPRGVRSQARQIEAARTEIEVQTGRTATDSELAAQLQITPEKFNRRKSQARAISLVSLNETWSVTNSDQDVCVIDAIGDTKGQDPTTGLQKQELMKLVTQGLNRNERLIIILYYYEELTMKDIGQTLGLSESRVSQIHKSILIRLRTPPSEQVSLK